MAARTLRFVPALAFVLASFAFGPALVAAELCETQAVEVVTGGLNSVAVAVADRGSAIAIVNTSNDSLARAEALD
jgi:hypothetical protein